MRKQTQRVMVGDVAIGGGAPVSIQSMTNTDTRDVDTTVAQILRLESAGCEIVRCSVYDEICAKAIGEIKSHIHIPLVADIHFDYRLAIAAIKHGVDKIRFNPGNIGSQEKVRELVAAAKDHGTPIRIGVNGGSLEKEMLERFHGPTPEALAESALKHAAILEHIGFYNTVISIKASDVTGTVLANRIVSQKTDYPLHIGITESGMELAGIVKSSMGIGSLLLDGIGDTIRVSLTGDPVKEVEAGCEILAALGFRKTGVEIVSCPTCGRCAIDLESVVRRVRAELPADAGYLKAAVMGCVVNGPGEAREADIGIAFAPGGGMVFKKGKKAYIAPLNEVVDRFLADAKAMLVERKEGELLES